MAKLEFMKNKGFSLLEIIVAMGLLAILGLSVLTLISLFQKNVQATEEKMTILGLQQTLMGVASGRNLCEKDILANPANYKIPTASFPPAEINIDGLYLTPTEVNPLAKVNEFIYPNLTVKVRTLKLVSIGGSVDSFFGSIKIEFDTLNVVRKPLLVSVSLDTAISGTDTLITKCYVPKIADEVVAQESQALCLSAGGEWLQPPAPRPGFCSFPNDTVDWF